jgi:hypothetical protein
MSWQQQNKADINLLRRSRQPLEDSPIKGVDEQENIQRNGDKASYWDVGMSWP